MFNEFGELPGGAHSPDLSKPSLKAAIALLRDRAKWPEGFEWDYSQCNTCAMGLFRDVWAQDRRAVPYETVSLLGIDPENAYIFSSMVPHAHITPEIIADKLEELV